MNFGVAAVEEQGVDWGQCHGFVEVTTDELVVPVSDPRIHGDSQDDRPAAAVSLKGRFGRVVGNRDEIEDKCLVQMLDDNTHCRLLEASFRPHDVKPADEGGMDFVWPYDEASVMDAGWEVGSLLGVRGWCVIQVPRGSALRQKAADRAQRLTWAQQKRELLPDYIGHQGAGKFTQIDPLKLKGEAVLSRKLHGGLPPSDPIERFDADISSLFCALAPATWSTLGFTTPGRTDSMVWLPFSGGRERADMPVEDLNDEDIEEGVVERHLHFLKRRRLCFLYLVDMEGGHLSLASREGLAARQSVDVPVQPGTLLVFRCDKFTFHYEPLGHHLTLAAWALEEAPRVELSEITGDPRARDELWGIIHGPGAPYHDCARVLSIACTTGGNAEDFNSAATMYVSGTDGGLRVPSMRFDTDMYFASTEADFKSGINSYQIHGGMCSDEVVMSFDHMFFGVGEDDALIMAPNQRKTLEVGYEALQRAAFTKHSLDGAPIMIYIGDIGSEWPTEMLVARSMGIRADGSKFEFKSKRVEHMDWMSAAALPMSSARLSYIFGTRGPVCHFDTACSSGLTAFCTAMYTLRRDTLAPSLESGCVGALAGGVNQTVDPIIYISNCAQGMLSHKGRCFTFDVSGDGYARGEGTSMVYTVFGKDDKYMELQEGCAIGNKVNQDGRSASMTAPNGPSQQMCIKASLREAQVQPHDITASECHGTGTALGDPIEVGSLRGVQETDNRDNALLCTSSKSNIGHLEANAGTTGLIKCIMMGRSSIAPPNVHLQLLNPHLDINGWPAVFETELCDIGQNSGLVGVSSFGVSGTNAHAEVWAKCKVGPNSASRFSGFDEPEKRLDQLRVLCPVTLGPIDYLTGEPATSSTRTGRAAVLRDELAPYDVSSFVYDGAYRFRRNDLEDVGEELESGFALHVCGSWTGFRKFEEMDFQEDDSSYVVTMALGETRCESFFLCLNKTPTLRLYPVVHNAGPHIWVHGPDDQADGRRWLIDGRDNEVPAGTLYQIRVWWGSERKKVHWEQVAAGPIVARYRHVYSVLGTWTTWVPKDMLRDLDEEGVWETTVNIGPSGKEEFYFARDQDPQQALYPARQNTSDDQSVPIRGPDHLGAGKYWVIRGRVDEEVRLRLEVDDGEFSVSVTGSSQSTRTWKSMKGWSRREYTISASWLGWTSQALVMDENQPGVFRTYGQVGHSFSHEYLGYVEFFKIMVDGDAKQAWYPELPCARSGECIVNGPGEDSENRAWMLRSMRPGTPFTIFFDPNAMDRRRILTWSWNDPGALTYGSEAA